ncbi:MAG TPA: stage 0 sporulation family protein [Limnochordales bacterium]
MEEMVRIVGVRFKRAGKIYYFTPGELEVSVGDQVLVETAAGTECGEVVIPPKDVPLSDVVQPVRRVIRRLEPADRERLLANREGEREAEAFAKERIAARNLPMKLVNAEYTFDRNRLTFFFVAEERVDFRELVKDLASRFGCRIEMRQIGVRDQAKEVGGIGVCGRNLCCTTWLGEFAPVSIRMAKDQELSLNPSKLTGQCGRLKCCLKFEADTYRRIREELPEVGAMVRTPKGTGQVVEVLVARESVAVSLGEGRPVLVSLRQLETGEAVVLTGKLAQKNGAAGRNGTAPGDEGATREGSVREDALEDAAPGNGAAAEVNGAAYGESGAAHMAAGAGAADAGESGTPAGYLAAPLAEILPDWDFGAPSGDVPDADGQPGEDAVPGDDGTLAAGAAGGPPGTGKARSRSRRRRPRRRRRPHRPPQADEEAG